jgi:hypothetical protein
MLKDRGHQVLYGDKREELTQLRRGRQWACFCLSSWSKKKIYNIWLGRVFSSTITLSKTQVNFMFGCGPHPKTCHVYANILKKKSKI